MKFVSIFLLLFLGASAYANITESEHAVKVVQHQLDVADATESCLQALEEKSWGFICRVDTAEKPFATPFTLMKTISKRSLLKKTPGVFSDISFRFSGLSRQSYDPKSKYVSVFSIVVEKKDLRDTPTKEEAAEVVRQIVADEKPELNAYYQVLD